MGWEEEGGDRKKGKEEEGEQKPIQEAESQFYIGAVQLVLRI